MKLDEDRSQSENYLVWKINYNTEQHDVIVWTQTIPSGSDPALVDLCKISSNWNVFEPGAAHTEQKESKSKIVRNTEVKIPNKTNRTRAGKNEKNAGAA